VFRSAKTFVLLAALSGLLLWAGQMFGGNTGLVFMLGVAVAMNLVGYFKSDTIAIRMARAEPIDERSHPRLVAIVRELSEKAGEPMPKLYVSPSPQLNAFATGRNPDHAAVCVNQGLLQALDERELRGVIGHELQHVYNRDILIGTVAAMIATAITFLARIAMWGAMLGGGRDNEGGNALGQLALVLLAPIAAIVIQLAVTRSRESLADETGAELTGDPIGLASALRKLKAGSESPALLRRGGVPAETSNAFAHMYITAPFGGRQAMAKLFSSHPPIEERIARLEQMAREQGAGGGTGPAWPTA
jgi:heat shock protein HtpX